MIMLLSVGRLMAPADWKEISLGCSLPLSECSCLDSFLQTELGSSQPCSKPAFAPNLNPCVIAFPHWLINKIIKQSGFVSAASEHEHGQNPILTAKNGTDNPHNH